MNMVHNSQSFARAASFGRFDRITKAMTPLTDDQIREKAPSVFAVAAHESRSARYTYIPTSEILAGLRSEGFMPMAVKQSRCRIPGKAEFTKHLIRFRRLGDGPVAVGDVFPEVALLNSHDGTSSYQLMQAMFRLTCLNGCYVAVAGTDDVVKVQHSGNILENVIEGSYRVIEGSTRALESPEKWSKIELNSTERLAMAEAARVLRFGDAEGNIETPIQASQLLATRRHEDTRPTLWNTFNVIQENAIKGGLSARGDRQPGHRHGRMVTSREVQGIDQDVRLNKALWTLAAKMAEIKVA